ncbi:hypothetical protein LCGC14_2204170 [marine sediment metagenome]|uniref:Transposase IS4-like domain-containing protein n=1 Tax=marine sediment metagenome TaxID=412755 RepID=A0A0F9GBI4_9ZZZZ|nr:MAG: hypothetical protein HeimC3_27340 [Candidatus Heimdallarchaeota archaeon LC_3]
MTTINNTLRIRRQLHQEPTKWHDVFKRTYFDKLLNKWVHHGQQEGNLHGKYPQALITSGIFSQALRPSSQHEFINDLEDNPIWRSVCGFEKYLPTQSWFSKHWNKEQYLEPVEGIFTGLRNLISLKKIPYKLRQAKPALDAVKSGYFPFLTDSTYFSLSEKRFDFATRGYAGPKKKYEPGAKIHLTIDGIMNSPMAFTVTEGKKHGSDLLDDHKEEISTSCKPWLQNSSDSKLIPLHIFDLGYWNIKRFWKMTKEGKMFICPKKKNSFNKYKTTLVKKSTSENDLQEYFIWKEGSDQPLRWISVINKKKPSKRWELLTNVLDLPTHLIISLYRLRWKIEQFFKWLKQHLGVKRPLVTSWTGFILHIYFNLILILLLQYYLVLLRLPRWLDNLKEILRQLLTTPTQQWFYQRFKIPLSYKMHFI